jgi:two-component system sensor histidine kinase KdpD
MSEERESRPDPDALLRSVAQEEKQRKRGRLRVFFGMCPGVGKTYAMLKKGIELRRQGLDVVIGIVETHGREETEKLASALPVVPAAVVPYRGTSLREMDLDTVLARKPELVLVDELAHTNAAGCRHPKRYQDVEELLDAGIDVYTTLNVQHVAGRADLVTQITGITVRETVPDSFLEQAEQMELIDISPPELLKRLGEGKVYLGDRAKRAAEHFFREEHLTALRELALRFIAETVDHQLRAQRTLTHATQPWHTSERLLVAVSSSPYSVRLIRATRRKAYALNAPWYALYVDTGVEERGEARERLLTNLALAAELGAEVLQTQDSSVAAAVRRMAEENNVTQIVMGRPDRRLFQDFFSGGTILDQLVRETSEIDIHIVRQERKPQYRGFRPRLPSFVGRPTTYIWALGVPAVVALLCHATLPWLGYRAVGIILLCTVMGVGTVAGLGPTVVGAAFASFAWNYFFIPPTFSATVETPEDLMMCLAFFPAACLTGLLTERIRRQEKDLLRRERRAGALYAFSRSLAEAGNAEEIAACAYKSLYRLFGFQAAILPAGPHNIPARVPLGSSGVDISAKSMAVAAWCLQNRRKAGQGTNTLAETGCLCLPLLGRNKCMGVLMLFPPPGFRLDPEQEALLDTLVSHLGVAFEREAFAAQSNEAEVLQHSERLHQALLNSVSHELRTPLTGLMGAASALRDENIAANPKHRALLGQTIEEGAERLNRVVENLLDMSRIAGGALAVKKEVVELGEFTISVLERGRRLLTERPVRLIIDHEVYARGDYRLLEHVLLNIFANVAAYTPEKSPVTVRVSEEDEKARLEVADEGPGIPEEAREKIFERFYRVPGTPTGGTGLGLSIAKALMEAQNGSISVRNRKERSGCDFTLELPTAAHPLLMDGTALPVQENTP